MTANKRVNVTGIHTWDIAKYVLKKYIYPAREHGLTEIRVTASDIHNELITPLLSSGHRYPQVCSAMEKRILVEDPSIKEIVREGPEQSNTTVFIYIL
jgi:hypothetical protein